MTEFENYCTCGNCRYYEGAKNEGICMYPRDFTMDTAADEPACGDWEES